MANTVDSYSETNNDNDEFIDGSSGDVSGFGQSFTGNGEILDSAKFYLKKFLAPTGNALAKVYAHTGTFGTSSLPTGAALATSDNFDVSTLSAVAYALITFSFSGANRITLTNATKYVVTIEYTVNSTPNSVIVTEDASSPTHAGNQSFFPVGGSWTVTPSPADTIFYVYSVAASSGGMAIMNSAAGLLLA